MYARRSRGMKPSNSTWRKDAVLGESDLPAAGMFATLTSIAVTGRLFELAAIFAAVLATIIAAVD